MPSSDGMRKGIAEQRADWRSGEMPARKGLTVPEMAAVQRWRVVRMGDGWGRARIGASPYDHVPCGGGFVERACRVVGYYIDSVIG